MHNNFVEYFISEYAICKRIHITNVRAPLSAQHVWQILCVGNRKAHG